MSKPSTLAASLMAKTATPAKDDADKRFLSGVGPTDDMSRKDRDMLAACIEVVCLMLSEAIRGAATALVSPLPARAKVLDVTPDDAETLARVSLKYDGTVVRANLPVAYAVGVGGPTRYLNFTVSVDGEVASYLAPFAARVAK